MIKFPFLLWVVYLARGRNTYYIYTDLVMVLQVLELQPLLSCVSVISVTMAPQVLAPDTLEVELFVSLFLPGSVSFQHTCWLRSSLCCGRPRTEETRCLGHVWYFSHE